MRTSGAWPASVLAGVAGACWVVTAERMHGMDMGAGTDLGGLGWFAVVWVTMMAAMMLPSLTPMTVAFARGARRPIAGAVVFAAGYLLLWAMFGLVAYALVEGVRSLDPGFLAWDRAGRYVSGGVIVGAALYELTTAKASCLRHCRDARLVRPRPGVRGALVMGLEQGRFCVGCSGALMVALFALGVMSIAWMIVVAAVIAAEKLLPRPVITTGASAAALAILGAAVMLDPGGVPWLTTPMPAM